MSTSAETTLEKEVDRYFKELHHSLSKVPRARRKQLLADLHQHVEEAINDCQPATSSELHTILRRIGAPRDIAAAALSEEAVDHLPLWRRRSSLLLACALLVICGGLASALVFGRTPSTPSGKRQAIRTPATSTPTTTVPPSSTSTTVASGGSLQATLTPATSAPTTTVPPSSSATTIASSGPLPMSGTYSDGPQGTPHYFVVMTTAAAGTLSGSLQFLYQDGQTSAVFTFSGTWQSGTATLDPQSIPQNGSASQNPSTVPSAISITYDQTGLQLGECLQYMHFANSMSDCSFAYGSFNS
jgi:hypothetical protein